MCSPFRISARGLLCFFLCAAAAGTLTLALAWAAPKVFGSANRGAPIAPSSAAVPREAFAAFLSSSFASGDEVRRGLYQFSAAEIRALLHAQDAAFWSTNSNAAMLLRQAAGLLGKDPAPEALLHEIAALLQQAGLEEAAVRRLLTAAFAGLLEVREVTAPQLVAMMRAESSHAVALLEVWLDFQSASSIRSDLATALALAKQAFPEMEEKLSDEIHEMVVRLWAHRAPPPAEALLFAKEMESLERYDLQERLLYEGARILSVTQPAELRRRLAQFGSIMPQQAGAIAAGFGLSFEEAHRAAEAMDEEPRSEFLTHYLHTISSADPREMSNIAAGREAKVLPQSAAQVVAEGLMLTGDFLQMDEWLAGLDPTGQAELLDEAMPGAFLSNPSALRYYFDKRPATLPPNPDSLRAAAWHSLRALPLDPLDTLGELQQSVDQLPQERRDQVQEFLLTRQLWAALAAGDENSFSLFHGHSEAVIGRAVRRILLLFPGDDERRNLQMGESWMQKASGNPKLQAEIGSRLIRSSIDAGDLGTAERTAMQLLGSTSAAPAMQNTLQSVVTAMAARNNDQAAAFIERIPPGPLQDHLLPSFTKQWAELDPAAAADWLAQQPAGAGRDRATGEVVRASRDDPESALANAAGIADPQLRWEAARSVLRVWRDADPGPAAAALAAAGFPPEELPRLRMLLGLPPGEAGAPQP